MIVLAYVADRIKIRFDYDIIQSQLMSSNNQCFKRKCAVFLDESTICCRCT